MSETLSAPEPRPPAHRIALVVAALAVIAVVVAAVVVSTRSDDDTGARPTGVTTASTATPEEGPFDLLRGVVDGAPPSVAYLAADELVTPDGGRLQLPRAYDAFALLGDQLVGSYNGDSGRVLETVTTAGDRVATSPLAAAFAVDGGAGVAAWSTARGELLTGWPGAELSLGDQGGPVTVAAVVCRPQGGGCRVFVNGPGERPPQSVTADGAVSAVAPGAIKVNDARADGLVAVQVSSSDTGSCSGVYDATHGAYLWRTCRYSLLSFSPDGSYLLATDPYLDGLGLSSISVIEVRTGDEVATFTIRGGLIAQQAWEDDAHPLVVIAGPAGWQILRLGLDGTRESTVGPVPAGPDPTLPELTLSR